MPNTLLLEMAAPSQDGFIVAQNELSSLRYQLKKVESSRRSDHANMQRLLKKQSQVKEMLEKEKSEMVKKFRLLKAQSLKLQDSKCSVELRNLLEKKESYCIEIEDAKRKIRDLTNQIAAGKHKLLQKRKSMDVSKDEDKAKRIQQKIELLESRLNKAICTYDELRQNNAVFREEINDMLWSRAKFFQSYSQMKYLINTQKQNIREIIGSATFAYNSRDEAKHRIRILTERTELDSQKLNEEMKSLHRVVEHDKKLCAFLNHRNKERLSLARKKMEESPLKDTQELEEKVKQFKEIYESIAGVAGTGDVETLIDIYHKAEEDNFSKFGLVNELNSEIEKLHENIKKLQQEICNIQSAFHSVKEKGRKSEEDVKSVLERLNSDVADLERSASLNGETLQQTRGYVKKLYDTTEPFFGPDDVYVESTVGIANHNALEYIEVLELRIVDLLNCNTFLKYKMEDESKDETITAVQKSTSSTAASDFLSKIRDSLELSTPILDTESHKDNPEITKAFFDVDEFRQMATTAFEKQHKGK